MNDELEYGISSGRGLSRGTVQALPAFLYYKNKTCDRCAEQETYGLFDKKKIQFFFIFICKGEGKTVPLQARGAQRVQGNLSSQIS